MLDRSRAFLANLKFRELLALFLISFLIASGAAGLGLKLTEAKGPGKRAYGHWVHEAAMGLAGSPLNDLTVETDDDGRRLVQAAISLGSLLLPSVALGAILFRLFVRDRTLVFRRQPALIRCAVGSAGSHEWRLILRLYPATYLLLLDLYFAVYVQQDKSDPDGGLVLTNVRLPCLNERWPVGDTHSPYSLSLPLREGDVGHDGEANVLRSIQGQRVNANTQLIVHVVGHIPELGSDFAEHHRVPVPLPLFEGGYYGVTVWYDGRGPSWEGWDNFERVRSPREKPTSHA